MLHTRITPRLLTFPYFSLPLRLGGKPSNLSIANAHVQLFSKAHEEEIASTCRALLASVSPHTAPQLRRSAPALGVERHCVAWIGQVPQDGRG